MLAIPNRGRSAGVCMKCSSCGHVNPLQQKFCGECGARLCAESPTLGDQPGGIGYTPPDVAERILQVGGVLEGERKHVTVMFCDISGSTPLAERVGPDRMHQLLGAFFELALAEVHRFGGTINQFLGDGFMALFGAPLAQEDHALRAVLAALAVRQVVASHPEFQSAEVALRMRMGIHSGAVVVGTIGDKLRTDYTAIGDTTNVAARIQSVAEPGSILASAEVIEMGRERVLCRRLGPHTLKGKSTPVMLFEVLGERSHRSTRRPVAATLVGRHDELQAIWHCITSLQQGKGSFVAISGEAGSGKSTLLQEAENHARMLHLRAARGDCLPYGRTLSYRPFHELMRAILKVTDTDGDDETFRKLQSGVSRLFQGAGVELLPFLALMLSVALPEQLQERIEALDESSRSHQIFRSALLFFEQLARDVPTMVVLDDWHWADASSVALLEHLLPLVEREALMIIVAMRTGPGEPPPRFNTEVAGKVEQRQDLVLRRLPAVDILALAEGLLGGGGLPASVREMLAHRSGGNPFFLAEIVRALVETKGIERLASNEDWRVTDQYDAATLPSTVEDAVLTRVDRLEEPLKQVIRAASVAGYAFLHRVVAAVVDANVDVEGAMVRLRNADFIEQRNEGPEAEYIFSHPLVQEAVYGSILESRRRILHNRIGECIESFFPERSEYFDPLLAHHFAEAKNWPKAKEYLLKSAEQASRIAADTEALDQYDRALSASENAGSNGMPLATRAHLQARMAAALLRIGHHEAALQHSNLALAALGIQYPTSQRQVLIAIASKAIARALRGVLPSTAPRRSQPVSEDVHGMRATISEALETTVNIEYYRSPGRFALGVLNFLEHSERGPPSRALCVSTSGLAMICDAIRLDTLAERTHRRAIALAESLDDDVARGYCYMLWGLLEYREGHWQSALEAASVAMARSSAAGHLKNWLRANGLRMSVLRSKGDPAWLEGVDHQSDVASSTHDVQSIGWTANYLGTAHLYRGNLDRARQSFETAINVFEAIPDYRALPGALAGRALCLAKRGQERQALSVLATASRIANKYRIGGALASQFILYSAEAQLTVMDSSPRSASRQLALMARRSVMLALRHGRLTGDESGPEALRLSGSLCWLTGERRKATAQWAEAMRTADLMGARYVAAKIRYEIGKRTGDAGLMKEAMSLFAEAGASPLARQAA